MKRLRWLALFAFGVYVGAAIENAYWRSERSPNPGTTRLR